MLVWYCRKVTERLYYVSENMGEFHERIAEFEEHVNVISTMETFIGEPIIENLQKHARAMVEEIKSYKEVYSLTHEVQGDQVVEESEV